MTDNPREGGMNELAPDFDEATHTYSIGAHRVPSVTQVIEAIMPRSFQPAPWYMERGSAIHKAIQLAAAGQLDIDGWRTQLRESLGDDSAQIIINKTAAATRFIRETGHTILHTEKRLASTLHLYAGTIDAIAERDSETVILDWKSSLDRRVELQLGGYARLFSDTGNVNACAVELRDDGSYRMEYFKRQQVKRFAQEFIALRSAYGSMQSRNLLPKGKDDGNRVD